MTKHHKKCHSSPKVKHVSNLCVCGKLKVKCDTHLNDVSVKNTLKVDCIAPLESHQLQGSVKCPDNKDRISV